MPSLFPLSSLADGAFYVLISRNHNLHRHRHIEGHCNNIQKGQVRVGFLVGKCVSGHKHADAQSGWHSLSRIKSWLNRYLFVCLFLCFVLTSALIYTEFESQDGIIETDCDRHCKNWIRSGDEMITKMFQSGRRRGYYNSVICVSVCVGFQSGQLKSINL